MNKPGFLVVMSILMVVPLRPVLANEEGIYESLEHIHLGRVFLSPAERANLDKYRGVRAPVAASSRTGQKAPAGSSSNAAGYIVSSSGQVRVWNDGDFVSAKTPASIRFPGDVKVTRAAERPAANKDSTEPDEASPAMGAADDVD